MPAASNQSASRGNSSAGFCGGLQVVRLLRIPQCDVVPVVRGQRGFQRHHAAGRALRVGHLRPGPAWSARAHGRPGPSARTSLPGSTTHPAGRGRPGRCRAGPGPGFRRPGRGRCRRARTHRRGTAVRPAPRVRCTEVVANTSRQPRPDRVQALGLDRGFVHEAVVEVPDLPLDAGGLRTACGGLLDDLLHRELRAVAQGGEGALQRPVVRDDRGALEPAAVHMLVQVILRPDAGVDGGQVDPRKWHGCSFERQAGAGALARRTVCMVDVAVVWLLHLTHPCYCEMVRAELLLLSCRGEASDAI